MNDTQIWIIIMICLIVITLGGSVLSKTIGANFENADLVSLTSVVRILTLVVMIIVIIFGGCIIDLYMIEGKMKKEMKSTIKQISNLNIKTQTKCNV